MTLRDGMVAASRSSVGATHQQLVDDMVGRPQAARGVDERGPSQSVGEIVASLTNVSRSTGILRDATLKVHAGEIVGAFGIRGSGPEELTQVLAGIGPHDAGVLEIAGRGPVTLSSPRQAYAHQISYVPSDRKNAGLVLKHSIARNLAFPQLKALSRGGVISRKAERKLVERALQT